MMKLPCFGLVAAFGMVCLLVSCENSTATEPPVINYTVSFHSGGGTAIADKTVQEGDTLNLELSVYQPVRSGFYFDGWYLQDDEAQIPITSITVNGDIVFVAKWISGFSITLEMEGGNMAGNPNFSSIRPGSTFEASLYVPSRTGYVFLWWYLEGAPLQAVENIQVNSDITLTALWEKGWIVTLNLNGGEYYGGENITVAKNAALELATIRPVVKDDHVLEGWYYDEGFAEPVPAVITVTEDIALYVKWVPLSVYAPLFGAWGGSAGTYLLYFEEDSLIGFYFSFNEEGEIRSFVWTDSTVDGKEASLADDTLTVGEGANADTFTRVQAVMMPAGHASISKVWIKGEGEVDDLVSLYLFDTGNASLYANGRGVWLSYAFKPGTLTLLQYNTDKDDNPLPGEVLLTIPVDDDGKPSGFIEMGDGGNGGDGGLVPFSK
jgi:uncharacterized repeat protein (TIGR02543 family)